MRIVHVGRMLSECETVEAVVEWLNASDADIDTNGGAVEAAKYTLQVLRSQLTHSFLRGAIDRIMHHCQTFLTGPVNPEKILALRLPQGCAPICDWIRTIIHLNTVDGELSGLVMKRMGDHVLWGPTVRYQLISFRVFIACTADELDATANICVTQMMQMPNAIMRRAAIAALSTVRELFAQHGYTERVDALSALFAKHALYDPHSGCRKAALTALPQRDAAALALKYLWDDQCQEVRSTAYRILSNCDVEELVKEPSLPQIVASAAEYAAIESIMVRLVEALPLARVMHVLQVEQHFEKSMPHIEAAIGAKVSRGKAGTQQPTGGEDEQAGAEM